MNKPLILMYHRIAEDPIDYWGLAVSPSRFDEQLSVLRRTRQPLPLAEFAERLADNTLPPDAVALTFDDGYVDNLTAALPRLAAADVPATIFLATAYLDSNEPFWWDDLVRLIMFEDRRQTFEFAINGQSTVFDFAGDPPANDDGTTVLRSLKKRTDVLEAVYHPLRRLDMAERRVAMAELRTILTPGGDASDPARPMTSAEVRTLAADGLVTIGAHTATHPLLPILDGPARKSEIAGSKTACEALVEAPVTTFAYPFGEFDAEAREAVKEAGFAVACSTRRAPVTAADDILALPRVYIPDLNGDAFEERLRTISATP